ncbi:hypothetical protein FB45DRAFT_1121525 [Roridomyces roridus]|uniref:F-box domain-containing protein n=1 Tax=Roridomyces roridus TaxID=1738132 RepID=A0AAD7FCC2_9AGAR|nr:hypothetical protein FB45DRAFT_1121525 [Roridomyces roridus]
MAPTLLSLPPELLLVIFEAIHDWHRPSVRHLVHTCRLARLLAEPILYRVLLVTTGSQAVSLAAALKSHQRSNVVATLGVFLDSQENVEALTPVIGTMTHLRSLSLEGPFVNRWEDERWKAFMQGYRLLFYQAARGVGLQNLESLTIHWAGKEGGCWRVSKISGIFKLPALQRLTLSRAALLDDLAEKLADIPTGATALVHLELIQCHVSPRAISAVLALPRTLGSCHLGNHETFYDEKGPPLVGYLQALHPQRRCLEELVWTDDDDNTDLRRAHPPGMSEFNHLRTLTVNTLGTASLALLLSKHTAPRNLERLCLFSHRFEPDSEQALIPGIPPASDLCPNLPALRYLDVVIERFDDARYQMIAWRVDHWRQIVRRLGAEFRVHRVEVAVFTLDFSYWTGSPPYTHGKDVPQEKIIYRCSVEKGDLYFVE